MKAIAVRDRDAGIGGLTLTRDRSADLSADLDRLKSLVETGSTTDR